MLAPASDLHQICKRHAEKISRARKANSMSRVVQDALNGFVGDLRQTHGANLRSIVLYGSAAAGDYDKSRSDYNLLIALERITPEDLRLAQAPMREWQRLGHPLPVYFTTAELRDAADVFPIEFHQMESARRVLYGEDPFENLVISDANLRHQTEYELRSKLIQLRRLYIKSSASVERLQDLMESSLTTFAALFAPALLLAGREPSPVKRETVRRAVQHFQLDDEPFNRIFNFRNEAAIELDETEANRLFARYLAQIERVIKAVDALAINGQ